MPNWRQVSSHSDCWLAQWEFSATTGVTNWPDGNFRPTQQWLVGQASHHHHHHHHHRLTLPAFCFIFLTKEDMLDPNAASGSDVAPLRDLRNCSSDCCSCNGIGITSELVTLRYISLDSVTHRSFAGKLHFLTEIVTTQKIWSGKIWRLLVSSIASALDTFRQEREGRARGICDFHQYKTQNTRFTLRNKSQINKKHKNISGTFPTVTPNTSSSTREFKLDHRIQKKQTKKLNTVCTKKTVPGTYVEQSPCFHP